MMDRYFPNYLKKHITSFSMYFSKMSYSFTRTKIEIVYSFQRNTYNFQIHGDLMLLLICATRDFSNFNAFTR